jgi:hypothetical protein
MSDEKASVNSKHSGVEKEPSPVAAPNEQMTGWRKVYFHPLIQIFFLGFILFMCVFPIAVHTLLTVHQGSRTL